ncbi:hypothetical protein BDP81DRAFT_411736 [Colletotrichum phormii]|uniref:Uncharacterized protein n=1 Tax=Colletotrichum phormii TaxID=359342 RepID=A0AAI9ZEF1_9PEZI|nr:uncharacterized protein BDP81DRAFT_411736 [Colletotrichum phormii]KAK1621879.1 hypothetical protein BDP81DRAFT_411736 [Colletotrichum phormii]
MDSSNNYYGFASAEQVAAVTPAAAAAAESPPAAPATTAKPAALTGQEGGDGDEELEHSSGSELSDPPSDDQSEIDFTPTRKGKKGKKKEEKKERKPKEPVVPGALREEPCLPCVQALVKGGDTLASVGCYDCLAGGTTRCAACADGKANRRCDPLNAVVTAAWVEYSTLARDYHREPAEGGFRPLFLEDVNGAFGRVRTLAAAQTKAENEKDRARRDARAATASPAAKSPAPRPPRAARCASFLPEEARSLSEHYQALASLNAAVDTSLILSFTTINIFLNYGPLLPYVTAS